MQDTVYSTDFSLFRFSLKADIRALAYNPFPTFSYTGTVRPTYPLSARRKVPEFIKIPDWAVAGLPRGEQRLNRSKITLLDAKGQEAMRKVCKLAREVPDITAAAVRPGITTDDLDEICHNACVERNVSVALCIFVQNTFAESTVLSVSAEL